MYCRLPCPDSEQVRIWFRQRKEAVLERNRIAVVAIATVLLSAGFASPAYCYLDPGTGSIILQALIAVVAGAAMALRLYWHRLRIFFSRKKSVSSGSAVPKDRDQA